MRGLACEQREPELRLEMECEPLQVECLEQECGQRKQSPGTESGLQLESVRDEHREREFLRQQVPAVAPEMEFGLESASASERTRLQKIEKIDPRKKPGIPYDSVP